MSLPDISACDTLLPGTNNRLDIMNSFNIWRLIISCIGFFMVSLVCAMPPAPIGPYHSIEDDFLQAPVSRPAPVTQQQAVEVTPEQADRNKAREWRWSAPSSRNQRGNYPAINPENYYPQSHPGSGYGYPTMGEPR